MNSSIFAGLRAPTLIANQNKMSLTNICSEACSWHLCALSLPQQQQSNQPLLHAFKAATTDKDHLSTHSLTDNHRSNQHLMQSFLAAPFVSCWAEALLKIARMTLTIKRDGNWSSFQLANSALPLSVTSSAIAPSARMQSLGPGSNVSNKYFKAGCLTYFANE